MNSAPAAQGGASETPRPRVKRVPKGTSAYQAAWIVDDDEGDNDEDDDELGSEMDSDEGEGSHSSRHCESPWDGLY